MTKPTGTRLRKHRHTKSASIFKVTSVCSNAPFESRVIGRRRCDLFFFFFYCSRLTNTHTHTRVHTTHVRHLHACSIQISRRTNGDCCRRRRRFGDDVWSKSLAEPRTSNTHTHIATLARTIARRKNLHLPPSCNADRDATASPNWSARSVRTALPSSRGSCRCQCTFGQF